jgi:ribonuclease PH
MKRIDGRDLDQFRKIKITKNYLSHPAASVLIECGGTKVICSVTVDPKIPPWMRAQKIPGGWLTCEYGMLPPSTHDRMRREASNGKQGGRTMEIQRLIGRSLRSVVDLEQLGQNTIYIDCDVIDADGGTRCASITGASVALQLALKGPLKRRFGKNVIRENIAAVSVGIVNGEPMLDLCYAEDSKADVDLNVVMTESGKFVEVQGTAEQAPFSRGELNKMLDLAQGGLEKMFVIQNNIINGNAQPDNGKKGLKRGANIGSMDNILGEIKL